jgi:ABC-type nitrate/sulfonate/bicarbonate transport system permease component
LLNIFWNSIKKSLIGFLIFIALWTIISQFFGNNLVPTPLTIIKSGGGIIAEKQVMHHYGVSLYRLLIGFIISFLSGTLIGVITYYLKVHHYIEDLLALLQVIPGVIIGTLLILFYGTGSIVPIGMIVIMITPIVASNTVNGLLDHTKELVEVVNVFGGGFKDIVQNVYIPKLIPIFKMNTLVCSALSLKIIILGEFVGCEDGLGFLFNNARIFYNMQEVYLYLLIIIITAVFFQVAVHALFLVLWKKYY